MRVLLRQEIIPNKLIRSSATTIQLPASPSSPVVLRIGGQFKVIISTLTCNLATNGFGGLDIGSLSQFTILNIYAVLNGTVAGLVASLNADAPSGFTAMRKLGTFNINHVPEVGGLLTDHDGRKQRIHFRAQTNATFFFAIAVYRRILYNSNIIDTHRILDQTLNWRAYIPVQDKYKFLQNLYVNDSSTGFSSFYQGALFLNEAADDTGSTNLVRYVNFHGVTASPFPVGLLKTDLINMPQGSWIDFRAYQNTGPARSMSSDNRANYCEFERPGDE